jgi:OOP family OmpA-OmpF porin
MKVKLLAGVAMAGLFTAGAAQADPNGWYGAVDIGYHMPEVSTNIGVDMEVDDDWAGFARLGYRFTENWRVEVEGGYRPGEIGELTSGGTPVICNAIPAAGPCEIADGDISATSLMMNVIYDFGSAESTMRPFVGLGAGVNRVNTDFLGTVAANRTVAIGADDSSAKLAAQAIFGVAWALSDRANLDLTYRYLMSNTEFDVFASSAPYDIGAVGGRYRDHSVSLGLRYAFGAAEPAYVPPPPPPPPVVTPPPPPRPPAPAPAPAPVRREFVVYFDWDRSDLTTEASQVVMQAANYAKSGRATRILVVGHADTSGSAAYNVGLSNRRARTVADALVAQGVNGGVISLDGKGETQLARPTADGVREPLNRRATIDINF